MPATDRLRWWLSLLLAALIAVAIVVAVDQAGIDPERHGRRQAAPRARQFADHGNPHHRRRHSLGPRRWPRRATSCRRSPRVRQVWLADTMRRLPYRASRTAMQRSNASRRCTSPTAARRRVPLPPAGDGARASETVVISDGVSDHRGAGVSRAHRVGVRIGARTPASPHSKCARCRRIRAASRPSSKSPTPAAYQGSRARPDGARRPQHGAQAGNSWRTVHVARDDRCFRFRWRSGPRLARHGRATAWLTTTLLTPCCRCGGWSASAW